MIIQSRLKMIAGLDGMARQKGELLELTHVARDGNAWQAGLTAGDLIVAFDKHHVRKDLKASLENFEPSQTIRVDFIRRDKLMNTKIKLDRDHDKPKKITFAPNPSNEQALLYKAWMGVSHPNEVK